MWQAAPGRRSGRGGEGKGWRKEERIGGCEIRKALEGLAVRGAAGRAATGEERVELNRQFHATLYVAAAMPQLAALISQLRSAVSYYVERAYQRADVTEQAAAEHADILAACRRGDGRSAADALARHLETSAVAAVEFAERVYAVGVVVPA